MKIALFEAKCFFICFVSCVTGPTVILTCQTGGLSFRFGYFSLSFGILDGVVKYTVNVKWRMKAIDRNLARLKEYSKWRTTMKWLCFIWRSYWIYSNDLIITNWWFRTLDSVCSSRWVCVCDIEVIVCPLDMPYTFI